MLSKRLKAARNAMKLTQDELAARVKTTKATISNYENEYSTPSNEILVRIARTLNVSTDYLLGNDQSNTSEAINAGDDVMEHVTAQFDTEYYKEKLNVSVYKNGIVEIAIENEDGTLGNGSLEKLQAYELAMFILKNL